MREMQIAEKKMKQKVDKMHESVLAEEMKAKMKESAIKEREESLKKTEKQLTFRTGVQQQIDERTEHVQQYMYAGQKSPLLQHRAKKLNLGRMNDQEIQLNKSLIDEAREHKRIKMEKMGGATRNTLLSSKDIINYTSNF